MSFYCNENHFLIFEHFGMYDILGDITKPLSESNDTMEKEDKALPDDIAEGNDSSSGEEQGGNSMTEEVKWLTDLLTVSDRQTDSLTDWLTDCLWQTDRQTHWLTD